jgi:hypothetical protein
VEKDGSPKAKLVTDLGAEGDYCRAWKLWKFNSRIHAVAGFCSLNFAEKAGKTMIIEIC